MTYLYSPHYRADRFIASARLLLVAFSLVAVRVGVLEPHGDSRAAYVLLSTYGIYSAIRCMGVWRARFPLPDRLPAHIADVSMLALFLFAAGSCALLFPLFALPLLSASLRWQRRGTLGTAVAIILVMLAYGVHEVFRHPGRLEVMEFAMQLTWLAIAAVLLGEMSAHEARSRQDLGKLASEPNAAASDLEAVVRDLPRWAADVLGAPRALLAWEEVEEPWLYLASWEDGESRCSREGPGLADLVAPDLLDADFLSHGPTNSGQQVLRTAAGGYAWWDGEPLQPALRGRFSPTSVLSVRFDREPARGRLFVFDKRRMTSDDLVLAQIVARQISGRLNQVYLLGRLAEQAAVDERLRLSRDLHDGALHALAGVALELEGLIRASKGDFADAELRLRELQTSLVVEQRTLRKLIGQLRAPHHEALHLPHNLSARLKDLIDRIERRWPIKVEWSPSDLKALPASLADEVYLAVHEGLVNAARHAGASVVSLDVRRDERDVKINISDNGRGFRFKGRYDQAALASLGLGPATLRERAVALNGGLTLHSSEDGTRLELSFPVNGALP